MKTFHYLCVCLCVTFLSIGVSTSALAVDYTLTDRAMTNGNNKGGITQLLTALTSDDTLIVTADRAQVYFNTNNATLNCNIKISGSAYGSEKTGKIRLQSSGNVINGVVTLRGDTIVGSHLSTGAFDVTFNGQITGADAMIYAAGNGSTVTLANPSDSAFNNYTGNTFLGYTGQYYSSTAVANNGIKVVLGASEQIPDAKTSGSTVTGNLVMNAYSTSQYASLNLNGFNETVNGLASGGTAPGNAVIFNNSETASVLTVGGNNATAEYSGKIGAGGTNLSLVKVGTGTQTLSNANTYTGGTTISGGRIIATNVSALGTGAVTNNSELEFNLTTAGTYDKVVSGSGELIKSGAGTLTISAPNTYTGSTTVSAGTLQADNASALGTGTVAIDQNGTLNWNNATDLANKISGAGTLKLLKGRSGEYDYGLSSKLQNFTGTIELGAPNSGTRIRIEWRADTNSILNNVNLIKITSGNEFWVSSNTTTDEVTIDCDWEIEGTGAGAGGDSTPRGALRTDKSAIFTGKVSLAADALIKARNAGSVATFSGDIDLNAHTLTIQSDNNINSAILKGDILSTGGTGNLINGTGTSTDTMTLKIGDTTAAAAATTQTIGVNIQQKNTVSPLTFQPGENRTIAVSGIISGTGALTKTETGTLTLSAVNTYTGSTTIAGGTLVLEANNAIASSAFVANNGVINYGATSQQFNDLSGTGTITGSGALTLFNNTGSSTTWSGTIEGSDSIIKTGTGTLTLSSVNDYDGTTTISAGTLDLGTANAITSSETVINNAAITATSAQTFNNLSGTVDTASITLTGGDLTLNNDDATTSKYLGKINVGTGNITKTGTGTMQLNGDENDIVGGKLIVNSGRLDLKGYLTGSLEVDEDGDFSPGNSVGKTNVSGDFILTGDLIMEIDSASSYDTLTITGTTTYNEGSQIILNLYVPTGAETLELNMINTNGVTGTEKWVLGENARYWQNATFSDGTLKIEVNLNAIPEPSTWALLILGALGMMYFRRKK